MIDVGHEQAAGDEMNRDETNSDETNSDDVTGDDVTDGTTSGDDFWGGTPDWSDTPQRQRRAKRSGDMTGAIKGLWATAMSAGADGTREHRVLDATAPLPADEFEVGPQMFDDLDDDDFSRRDTPRERTASHHSVDDTTDVPVIDVFGDEFDDEFDDDAIAAMAPVSVSERAVRSRRSGAIDPLLIRIGAVAIATTLLVPLAIGLASGSDETGDTLASATTEIAATTSTLDTTTLDTTTLDTTPLADAAESPAAATSTQAGLDPESLPPAVPVDQGTTASSITDVADDSTEHVAESSTSESGIASSGSDTLQSESGDADPIDGEPSAGDGADRVPKCAIDYTVVSGDFWLRLADAADVTLAELLEANGASVDTPLYPGAEICLPAGATTPAAPSLTADAPTTEPTTTSTANPTTTSTANPTTTNPTTTNPTTTNPTTTNPTTTNPTTTAPTTSPTTAPTTSPTTTAPTSGTPNSGASPDEVKQIIRDVWPDELEERALEIAMRESRYVPTAKNYCCYGIFQIYWSVHKSWLAGIGITNDQQLYDPATNARAAYALYQRAGGWGPWAL